VALNDSATISGNTAGNTGGGIYSASGTMTGATADNITGNKPDNCAPADSVPGCSG
jgi:predicted outer membrane repeat protein